MSVLNRPFSKLTNVEGTETGFVISFKKFPEVEETFYKNLKMTITKMASSKKTKMLSLLVDAKVLSLGYSLTHIIHNPQPVYGINYHDDKTLRNIVIDVAKIVPASYHTEFISNLSIISNQVEVIKQNESMLTSTGTEQIKMAKDSINEKYQDLLSNIDWFLAADIFYFQYLKFLTKFTVAQNKGKVFATVNEILHSSIKKMILGYSTKTDMTFAETKLIQILIDYLMVTEYSNNPPQQTLNAVIKATIQQANERNLEEIDQIVQRVKDLKPTRFSKLEDITFILADAKIMNITPNTFNKLMTETFGQKYFEFNGSLDGIVAYFISLLYTSEIFSIKGSSHSAHSFKEETQSLEELILNAKGSTILKSF